MIKKYFVFIASLFLLLANNSAMAISIFDWPQIFKDVASELNQARDKLSDVQDIVDHIDKGEPIPAHDDTWKAVANNFSIAAGKLTAAPLPTDFDKSEYTVSLADLTSCKTRDASVEKLKTFTERLKNETAKGNANLLQVDQALASINSSKALIKYLKEMSVKLSGVPVYGETFLWNWFDLEVSVSSSLAKANSVLEKYKISLVSNISLAKTQADNLESNIKLFDGIICEISGRWQGECRSASGKVSPLIIDATPINGKYNCQFTRPGGASYSCRDFRYDEKTSGVSFIAQQNAQPASINWTGNMASNAQVMKLQYSVGTAKGTCSLSK